MGGGGEGMVVESRGLLLCHRKLAFFFLIHRARPSTAPQTVWHASRRRKPLERSQPPPPTPPHPTHPLPLPKAWRECKFGVCVRERKRGSVNVP